jgi:HK97 family phage major capsid protein
MINLRDLPGYRPDAPGARLDDQPWAKSWATYLKAVFNPAGEARRVIRNTWSERVPSEGGFLVPETLRAQVMAYMTTAIVRPRATVVEMDSPRLGIPLLDNPSQASGKQALGGLTFSIVEVGETIPATNPALGRLVLEARKIAAYLQGVPNELTDDAAGAMGDLLARVIALGLAWFEDDLFIFNGTGAGEPQSLANGGAALAVNRGTSDKVLVADIAAMLTGLHPAALQAGLTPGLTHVRWLISSAALPQLLELYLNTGGSTAGTDITPATTSEWFQFGDGHDIGPSGLGLPASITDHQPALGSTGDVMLADLSQYVISDRLTMTVEQSKDGAGFIKDTSNFRIRSRVDGRYWIQSQSTTEAGAAVSPVVVLAPPAG